MDSIQFGIATLGLALVTLATVTGAMLQRWEDREEDELDYPHHA